MKKNTSTFISIIALTGLIACGSGDPQDGNGCSGIICGVDVTSYEQNGTVYAEFKAILNIGSIQFPAFNIPVKAPKTDAELGVLWVGQNLLGQTEMGFRFDLSAAQTGDLPIELNPVLPNGNPIPIVGLQNATTIAYTVKDKNIKIYASYGENIALMGVAVPVRQLDETGSSVCPSAIMPTFNAKGVRGAGGVYFGCNPGQSGIGLFVDVSSAIKKDASIKSMLGIYDDSQNSAVDFVDLKPESRSQERKAERALYKFYKQNKGKTVTIE